MLTKKTLVFFLSASEPQCHTTIPTSGHVLEDAYNTAECVIYFEGNLQPIVNWTGPSPYSVHKQSSSSYVWSGIEVNITRFMENQTFLAFSYFEDAIPAWPDSSSSAPTWNYTFETPALTVNCE